MDNKYISPCHAASLFGIITSKGEVYPVKLHDRLLGNLRENMNFSTIWKNKKTNETKKFIIDSKCSCTYELPYHIIS